MGVGGSSGPGGGADAELERVFAAGLDAAAAVEAVAGGNAARFLQAGEADDVGFGTGAQAVAAAVASCVVKADAHDGGARQATDERPEGAERAEVTAPAVLHERKVEREDRGGGRERCEPRAEDEITPDPGLRAHRLEGGRARGGAQNERGGEKAVADLVRDAHDVGLEL